LKKGKSSGKGKKKGKKEKPSSTLDARHPKRTARVNDAGGGETISTEVPKRKQEEGKTVRFSGGKNDCPASRAGDDVNPVDHSEIP